MREPDPAMPLFTYHACGMMITIETTGHDVRYLMMIQDDDGDDDDDEEEEEEDGGGGGGGDGDKSVLK